MTGKKSADKTKRRMYRKPQLEEVQLVVEEAVLEACKVKSGGPGGFICNPKPGSVCGKARGRS